MSPSFTPGWVNKLTRRWDLANPAKRDRAEEDDAKSPKGSRTDPQTDSSTGSQADAPMDPPTDPPTDSPPDSPAHKRPRIARPRFTYPPKRPRLASRTPLSPRTVPLYRRFSIFGGASEDVDMPDVPEEIIQTKPIFADVRGVVPHDHPEIMSDFKVRTVNNEHDLRKEEERGLRLQTLAIEGAPRWYEIPPFEQMENITLEELIMYFPNHVLRWPGLALALRLQNWDNLFHQTATLINRVRGSQFWDRNDQHADPLQCALKVQKAIQEFDPAYCLDMHDQLIPYTPDVIWMQENMWRKPKAHYTYESARTLTLEEIGEYVSFPEFQDRPFTQRVQRALAEALDRKVTNPIVRKLAGFDNNPRGPRNQHPRGPLQGPPQGPMGPIRNLYPEMFGSPPSFNPSLRQPGDRRRSSNVEMVDAGSRRRSTIYGMNDAGHANAPGDPYNDDDDFANRGPPSALPAQEQCRLGSNCKDPNCPYIHPNYQAPYVEELVDDQEQQYAPRCKWDQRCNKPLCLLAHASPAAPKNIEIQLDQQCRYNADCRNRQCIKSHPSPASKEQVPQMKPCHHNQRCNNSSCSMAHTSPAAPVGSNILLDQACKYKLACTNYNCQRWHPSPASGDKGGKGGGGKGGKGGKGNGNGENGNGGNGNGSGRNGDGGNGNGGNGNGGNGNGGNGNGGKGKGGKGGRGGQRGGGGGWE